jgi:hypothetical protein
MRGIAEWLASIGLERYAQRFVENAIDGDVLAELKEADLEKLGPGAAPLFANFCRTDSCSLGGMNRSSRQKQPCIEVAGSLF